MKLEILMSCMHQSDDTLVRASQITSDVVVINQCDREDYAEYPTEHGLVRMFSTTQRGLTKSRNLAIAKSNADVCLLCDDDEVFQPDYREKILEAYKNLPQADVIIFKMVNRQPSFPDQVMRLRFPRTMKVSSWQISFRKASLTAKGVAFDELLGAGTGNGAEEELKFLWDCQKAGLQIYYVPAPIATVAQTESTWFGGFTEEFFINRGATTRYIMGLPLACAYALYYCLRKRSMYASQITMVSALKATFRGIRENKITKQRYQGKEKQ
jgi:glycosyltransferase involved in cell wall biosynthesis